MHPGRFGPQKSMGASLAALILLQGRMDAPSGLIHAEMHIPYSFIGSAIWNITLFSLGYLAGEHWENVSRYVEEYKRVAEIGIILLIIWYIIKKLKKKNV